MELEELRELIEEQKRRLRTLYYHDDDFNPYYYYEESENQAYIRWIARAKRYLDLNFNGDKYIDDFCKACNEINITLKQQTELLAILEAFEKHPKIIENIKTTNKHSGINIHNSITNTQNQSQSQEIKILLNSLEDELSVRQLKELKQIVDKEKGDLEKAKPKLIEKIKSFSENVASNILANIITNPTIWSSLG